MERARAAGGTVHRVGNGKLRHVRISDLWLQERVKEGSTIVSRISGAENIADMLVTREVSHFEMSLLKVIAPWNIPNIVVTLETSEVPMSWLIAAALLNMLVMFHTPETSQPPMSSGGRAVCIVAGVFFEASKKKG